MKITSSILSLAILVFLLIANVSFSQVITWGTTGNTVFPGNYIGSNNNEDFLIKTNGNNAVKVKANGNFILKSLEGTGNGIVLFDNNGKLNPLNFSGSTSDVLLGNGTFGAVPNIWSTGGSGKIYYNGGKVGIGTASPNFKLDVDGDVRITQNLYLQGAMIISDKIETPKQMKAKAIEVDSIMMDSTRAFYGETNFKGDVKLQSKLNVNGNTTINGSLSAISISAANFDVSSLLSANKISANRITGVPGDTLVLIGDSTMILDFGHNRISTTPTTTGSVTYGGLALGTNAKGLAAQSIAIGSASVTSVTQSIAIGASTATGSAALRSVVIGSGSTTPLLNNIPRTLMIGFNSDVPTVFVSASSGSGTTGAVAIGGTYIPTGFKLAVEGKIIAEEVNVKLRANWPDYVFEDNYKLISLPELERYLKINHHLPEMPSAYEIKDKGINTSEIITNLVKRQEELTLYIIEQDKKIKQLEAHIKNK